MKKKDTSTKVKYYLLMIFKYIVSDSDCPSCKNKKDIEKYCETIISILNDIEKCEEIFIQTNDKFNTLAQQYYQKSNNSDFIDYEKICKQQAFTDFILSELNATNKNLPRIRQNHINSKQLLLPLEN